MTTTLKAQPRELEKKVLVSSSDFDVYCAAHLRMAHNETAKQGSITISIKANLANFGGELQVLRLIVPPERIDECALERNSNDDLLPSRLVEDHPARPKKKSDVLTLTLKLNLPGIVLCPSETETLRPTTPGDLEFHSFAKISRSKSFCLHFSERQFVKDQIGWLEIFISALSARCLRSEPLDHSRHRGVEKDWSVFGLLPEPPPYNEEPPPYHGNAVSERGLGKRPRGIFPFFVLISLPFNSSLVVFRISVNITQRRKTKTTPRNPSTDRLSDRSEYPEYSPTVDGLNSPNLLYACFLSCLLGAWKTSASRR
jgi:hypothetical protein